MSIPLYHVNAFSSDAFGGNPAAVCILTQARTDDWMLSVAAQMNLSETAFVFDDGQSLSLRWFTPEREVELCGHATLASAHALWHYGYVAQGQKIVFQSRAGVLTAEQQLGLIQLDFPATAPKPVNAPAKLVEMLAISPIYTGKFGAKYLFEVETEQQLLAIKPNMTELLTLPERGVSVTCADSSGQYDFISRYFAPWVGIDEDPVNGSSHCALTPYWSQRLAKTNLTARQASVRGGDLSLQLVGGRVKISGAAVTVLAGQLLV
ncbi:MAG: hypothetical protein OFPI_39620 [Osedax symbiont Rs2]|nr:MAG: hypothetical protein OFPI_39620 [Osedax symbiont Rs2]